MSQLHSERYASIATRLANLPNDASTGAAHSSCRQAQICGTLLPVKAAIGCQTPAAKGNSHDLRFVPKDFRSHEEGNTQWVWPLSFAIQGLLIATVPGAEHDAAPAATAAAHPAGSLLDLKDTDMVATVNDEEVLAGEIMGPVNATVQQRIRQMRSERPEKEGPRDGTGIRADWLRIRPENEPEWAEALRQELAKQHLRGLIEVKLVLSDARREIPSEGFAKFHEAIGRQFEKEEVPKLLAKYGADNRKVLSSWLILAGTTLAAEKRAWVDSLSSVQLGTGANQRWRD